MDQVKLFRENTRRLEMNLGNINKSDCCCCGISDTQCFILVEIGRKPDISVKELAGILRLDKSGISRMVEELVQKEFVERKPSKEDRRYVVLNLTVKGSERFNQIENNMNIKFKSILDRIPEEKRNQVIEALELYNVACEANELKD
ncbi:MAG: putative HTH-type transcriptional regulator YusO [Firmicutes bacterium ADurb.Bin419]|jgi:DNA-binding MarR family transcriptional regulator|nr:MAG: putative HTH-type transcriptional regulator YusO [Firmicutes bacterium ADurb.Bin419]